MPAAPGYATPGPVITSSQISTETAPSMRYPSVEGCPVDDQTLPRATNPVVAEPVPVPAMYTIALLTWVRFVFVKLLLVSVTPFVVRHSETAGFVGGLVPWFRFTSFLSTQSSSSPPLIVLLEMSQPELRFDALPPVAIIA